MPKKKRPDPDVSEQLAAFFERNGYIRLQNAERLAADGYKVYKKGSEVRLIAVDKAELRQIRQLLRAAGFKPGEPYKQRTCWRQPMYGRKEVARFLEFIGKPASATE